MGVVDLDDSDGCYVCPAHQVIHGDAGVLGDLLGALGQSDRSLCILPRVHDEGVATSYSVTRGISTAEGSASVEASPKEVPLWKHPLGDCRLLCRLRREARVRGGRGHCGCPLSPSASEMGHVYHANIKTTPPTIPTTKNPLNKCLMRCTAHGERDCEQPPTKVPPFQVAIHPYESMIAPLFIGDTK